MKKTAQLYYRSTRGNVSLNYIHSPGWDSTRHPLLHRPFPCVFLVNVNSRDARFHRRDSLGVHRREEFHLFKLRDRGLAILHRVVNRLRVGFFFDGLFPSENVFSDPTAFRLIRPGVRSQSSFSRKKRIAAPIAGSALSIKICSCRPISPDARFLSIDSAACAV